MKRALLRALADPEDDAALGAALQRVAEGRLDELWTPPALRDVAPIWRARWLRIGPPGKLLRCEAACAPGRLLTELTRREKGRPVITRAGGG